MTLEDKIITDINGDIRLPAHLFSAALTLWATGHITKQNIVDFWSLDATESTQLDQISAAYAVLTATQKAAYHGSIEAANIAIQHGAINVTKWKAILGITT